MGRRTGFSCGWRSDGSSGSIFNICLVIITGVELFRVGSGRGSSIARGSLDISLWNVIPDLGLGCRAMLQQIQRIIGISIGLDLVGILGACTVKRGCSSSHQVNLIFFF